MEISSSKEESWEFANLICDPFEDINDLGNDGDNHKESYKKS